MAKRDIIVIGASYGGVQAVSKLLSFLPTDLAASVFIVLHIAPNAVSALPEILTAQGTLPAVKARPGEKFACGTAYVAVPNHHLLVKKDHVKVVFGPRENRHRPSIDVLFRSAAVYHTTRVIAVLLTGYLSDGVGGLSAVKSCGGVTMVQDPVEAAAADLPLNAIENASVDHILPLREIAAKIVETIGLAADKPPEVPEELMEEVFASEHEVPDLDHMKKIGENTPYTCPECGGALWKMKNEPITRYVCHTGHSFTLRSYLEGQAETIENSLWSAVRYMHERVHIIQKLAADERKKGREKSAEQYEKKGEEMKGHALVIRRLIMSGALVSVFGKNTVDSAEAVSGL